MKVSRYHATIELVSEGLLIKNISTTQDIKINGISKQEAFLEPGQVITIGETNISLIQEAALSNTEGKSKNLSPLAGNNKKKPLFYVYIILAVGFFYLLLSDSPENIMPEKLRDQGAIQAEIEEAKKITEALENAKFTSGKDSKQYLDAKESYLKGFRDYREENYSRAITNFEATLALYPKHPLAKHYLNLARRKLDEQIQFFMQEGNRFMEHGRYNMAISSFKNAMVLIKDNTDPNYKEAFAKYEQSKAIIEEAF